MTVKQWVHGFVAFGTGFCAALAPLAQGGVTLEEWISAALAGFVAVGALFKKSPSNP